MDYFGSKMGHTVGDSDQNWTELDLADDMALLSGSDNKGFAEGSEWSWHSWVDLIGNVDLCKCEKYCAGIVAVGWIDFVSGGMIADAGIVGRTVVVEGFD